VGVSSALGSSALLPAGLGFRNVVINGDMAIDQRNAGAAATSVSAAYVFPVDRFKFYQAAGSKITGQRVAKSASASNAPEGFQYSLKLTNAASGTTPAAGDEYQLYHLVEANSTDTWDWGYSTAKQVVLSFWVRSSVTGTYAVTLYNAGTNNRSYVTTYTVNAADTWEKKTVYVNGDTAGTWTIGASTAVGIIWDLGSGSNLNATPNAWASAFDTRTSGSVTWISTGSATFYITGVQLEQNVQPTPFEQRPYGVELALCQRYYEKSYDTATSVGTITEVGVHWHSGSGNGSGRHYVPIRFKVEKRSNGYTVNTYDPAAAGSNWRTNNAGQTGLQRTPSIEQKGTSGFVANVEDGGYSWVVGNTRGHWVVDAEL
jgi:hypothetical protein